MKTLEQILSYKSQSFDGRDLCRLACFIPVERLGEVGLKLIDGAKAPEAPTPLTQEEVMGYLKRDLEFAFEKALNKRGLSARTMNSVIRMWMWILDDELADCEEYAQYGLPLLKKVAVKYNLPNQIGDDYGNESKYACDYE